jgi:eukaryotic-like serine/threonine-protein kinase
MCRCRPVPAAQQDPPRCSLIDETISHYRIVAELGAGGMGVVYKAEDLKLGRFVALKFLSPQFMRDPDAKRRLFSEARAASVLDHPNVCPIYDIEETPDGRVFLSMAYCEGETLKQRLERGPIPPVEAARIAIDIGRGLAKAHQAGIIHRDVKPGNIMLLEGGTARLLDFGIARLSRDDITQSGTTLGTIAYMSPEQVKAQEVGLQSDGWSLGVVLYEMLAGRRPFTGASDFELLQAIVERPATAIPGVPAELTAVVSRALEKEPSRRFATVFEMVTALDTWLQTTTARHSARIGAPRGRLRIAGLVAGAVAVVLGSVGVWYWQSRGTRWARTVALPEIQRLAEQDRYGEAFLLAMQADSELPGDPVLGGLWARISSPGSINTTPEGADVSFRLIGDTGSWHALGRTPLTGIRLPRGVYEWRLEKAGYDTVEFVRGAGGAPAFSSIDAGIALPARGSRPEGMVDVTVPASGIRIILTGYDYNRPVPAQNYFIDQHEVTNAAFKVFVDAGGYQKREYWTEPFRRDGQTLDWSSAVVLFRDRTGRSGPSTWEGGTPAPGTEQHPVTGVSWYEAAAYAAFRGKHLPTVHHWSFAAGPHLAASITRTGNFGGRGAKPVTTRGSLGPFGTYNMAGNVKEWVWNAQTDGTSRYILGGAWNEPDYQFLFSDLRSPFDRSETNGFRCATYANGSGPPAALAAPLAPPTRDYSTERPIPDAAFRIYAEQYRYDRTPLDVRVESNDDSHALWRHELVSIAAGYGNERLPIHLYLPKGIKPPYQTVLYFPGSTAIRTNTSATLPVDAFDFIVMSGRAVVYPVYKYTYERMDSRVTSTWGEPTRAYATWIQQLATDVRRAIDYAGMRPELDTGRLAYAGLSWGARLGPLMIALERRIQTGILVMGGLGTGAASLPETDPFNFAPRVAVPILMLNGNQDFIFPVQTSQLPLLQTLGTPAADKRHVLYPGGHDIVISYRSQVVQEVVGWLDRYLGRVQ